MPTYALPEISAPAPAGKKEVILVASGDLRLSANRNCWPAQKEMEPQLTAAI